VIPASVSYPGINTALGAEFTLSRGVSPSVCTLWMMPQASLNLPPGTLSFVSDNTISFPDAAIDLAFLRKNEDASRQRWSVQILDRRWRWKLGSVSGEYNTRLPNGQVVEATRKTPGELATLIFAALGETADVSRMPATVFPPVAWNAITPAQALKELCEYVGCEVALDINNRVTIWPLGMGSEAGDSQVQRHPAFRVMPRRRPNKIVVQCGPTRYQSKLELEAVGKNEDGKQYRLDQLSYAPEDWSTESFWSFPSVTDDDDRAAAFESVYRHFRVKGQAGGGWDVPGCSVQVDKLSQLLPLYSSIVQTAFDLDDTDQELPAHIDGEYWPYADGQDNTDNSRYTAPWKLHGDQGLVETRWPTFSLDESSEIAEPTLYLTCSYNVRKPDGALDRLEREAVLAPGSGALTIQRPELYASKYVIYASDGISQEQIIGSEDKANAEADAYLAIFQRKYQDAWAYEREYAGFLPVSPDGKIAQVRWSCAMNRAALTHASVNAELDVFSLGAA
jgi:hypothetical protein